MSWGIQSIPDSGIEKYTFRGYLSLSTPLLTVVVVVVIIIIIIISRLYFLFRIKASAPLPYVSNDFCKLRN